MCDHESEIVEWEVGGAPQGVDDGAFRFDCLPEQPVVAGRAVEAVAGAALAPLAHCLGADAVMLGHGATRLDGTGVVRTSDCLSGIIYIFDIVFVA